MSDEYKAFIVSIHRCVVARNEKEALSLLPADLLSFSIREVRNKRDIGEGFQSEEIHLPEELVEYKDQVSNLTYFILPDDETGFLDRLDDINQGLSMVRSAIAHPSTFPKVPELERSDLDILICCRRLAWGESVDMDLRHYLFLRYPELQEVVVLFREEEESHDLGDANAEEETQP